MKLTLPLEQRSLPGSEDSGSGAVSLLRYRAWNSSTRSLAFEILNASSYEFSETR